MVRDVVSVWRGCNYKDLRKILRLKKRLQFFPLVESLGIFIIIIIIKVLLIYLEILLLHLGSNIIITLKMFW